jgi:hypothetical protein
MGIALTVKLRAYVGIGSDPIPHPFYRIEAVFGSPWPALEKVSRSTDDVATHFGSKALLNLSFKKHTSISPYRTVQQTYRGMRSDVAID